MNSTISGIVSAVWRSTRVLLALLVVLGLFYPAAVWIAGRAFAHNADGSMMSLNDRTVGSSLIAQDTSKDPALFHPRMSAGNYDGLASGGSNLSPVGEEITAQVAEQRALIARENGVDEAVVPADAVTASSSGLDPHISPEYARIQIERVAKNSGLSRSAVAQLVKKHTQGRTLGFAGEEVVNVNDLNLDLLAAKD